MRVEQVYATRHQLMKAPVCCEVVYDLCNFFLRASIGV